MFKALTIKGLRCTEKGVWLGLKDPRDSLAKCVKHLALEPEETHTYNIKNLILAARGMSPTKRILGMLRKVLDNMVNLESLRYVQKKELNNRYREPRNCRRLFTYTNTHHLLKTLLEFSRDSPRD